MRNLANRLISALKKEPYRLDDRIPLGYLAGTMFRRGMMAIRGLFTCCKKGGLLFRGHSVTLRCLSKMQFGNSVTIENGCYFDALSVDGIRIGNSNSFGKNCIVECTGNLKFLGKGLTTGNHVALGSGSFLGCAGGIVIEENTIIGNNVSFHAENHNYDHQQIPIRLQGVNHQGIHIGPDCWIGAKVTILDGAVVEEGCIVAAGALLIKGRYEKYGIYGGVPAKLIKKRF